MDIFHMLMVDFTASKIMVMWCTIDKFNRFALFLDYITEFSGPATGAKFNRKTSSAHAF